MTEWTAEPDDIGPADMAARARVDLLDAYLDSLPGFRGVEATNRFAREAARHLSRSAFYAAMEAAGWVPETLDAPDDVTVIGVRDIGPVPPAPADPIPTAYRCTACGSSAFHLDAGGRCLACRRMGAF